MENKFVTWFKGISINLRVFLITFIVNNLIIWLVYAFYSIADTSTAIMVLGVFILPISGGICRGIFSTMSSKKFWIINSIWAIILAVGYVPLVGMLNDATFGEYGIDIIIGLVVAGIMLASSAIGFAIRKVKLRRSGCQDIE